jgi:hypothetical protein
VNPGSIGIAEPAWATPVARPEFYRSFPDCPHFPLGDRAELVYSPLTREACILSPVAVGLVHSCWTFATLQDHAARLCRQLNLAQEQERAVLGELSALVKTGLLVSRTDLENHCRLHSDTRCTSAPIATIGIPTRNRPESLACCLESYLESGRRRGRTNDYVIVDDTEDALVRERNREMLRSLQARFRATIHYAGPAEKARYAEALLKQSGLPPDAVQFGLLNPEACAITTGSSRNLLLLHTVGDVLLQVDDDTLGCLAPAPSAQRGLAFSSRYDPTEFWFPEEGRPISPEMSTDGDLLAIHETLLGRSLGECLATRGGVEQVDLDQTSAAFFRKLGTGRGRVLVTAAGVAGDSGMGSSLYFLSLDATSRTRLLRTERAYRHTLETHQVMRAVTRPTVCDRAFCMALNLGLDNRQLLPPFMPVQRNQDGIFAAVARTCVGDSFFGFLPWVLLHAPPTRPRLSPAGSWNGAIRLHSGQMIQALLRSITLRPDLSNVAQNLRELGKAVTAIGCLPMSDFEEFLRLQVWDQMSKQASQFAGQLQQFGGQPDFWANDVHHLLAMMREELAKDRYAIPWDLSGGSDDRSAAELFRRLVLRFGQLLQVWPDMVEAARDLRAHGVRPASKI